MNMIMKKYVFYHNLKHLKKLQESFIKDNPHYNMRLCVLFGCVLFLYALIITRLLFLGVNSDDFKQPDVIQSVLRKQVKDRVEQIQRPNVYDRNGQLLAHDLYAPSLYATPYKIPNPGEIEDELMHIFPSLDRDVLRRKLYSDSKFVWLKRGITQKQKEQVYNLGFPWLAFKDEIKRVYPNGHMLSHVLGYTNINNKGQDGIELYIDTLRRLSSEYDNIPKESVYLTIDGQINYFIEKQLREAIKRYQAIGGAAIMMNMHNGEILALASLPDFDPNHPVMALNSTTVNRISRSRYELGSTIKPFTYALFLEYSERPLESFFDISQPLTVNGFVVKKSNKTHKNSLSLAEGFITSNNIVSSQIVQEVGFEEHLAFLKEAHLLKTDFQQFPGSVKTQIPKMWNDVSSTSSAFGYGIALSPLRYISSVAVLLNGGYAVEPTLIKSTGSNSHNVAPKKRILKLKDTTIESLYALLSLNVTQGTGIALKNIALNVGGKTGTAKKAIAGKYSDKKVLTSFISVFPLEKPQYLLFVMLDEPKSTTKDPRKTSSYYNAAPLSAQIIDRLAVTKGLISYARKRMPNDDYLY